jgi:hypothetical protein
MKFMPVFLSCNFKQGLFTWQHMVNAGLLIFFFVSTSFKKLISILAGKRGNFLMEKLSTNVSGWQEY